MEVVLVSLSSCVKLPLSSIKIWLSCNPTLDASVSASVLSPLPSSSLSIVSLSSLGKASLLSPAPSPSVSVVSLASLGNASSPSGVLSLSSSSSTRSTMSSSSVSGRSVNAGWSSNNVLTAVLLLNCSVPIAPELSCCIASCKSL